MGTTNLDSLTSKGSVNYMALSLLLDSFFILFFTNVGWLTVFRIEGGTDYSRSEKKIVLASLDRHLVQLPNIHNITRSFLVWSLIIYALLTYE